MPKALASDCRKVNLRLLKGHAGQNRVSVEY